MAVLVGGEFWLWPKIRYSESVTLRTFNRFIPKLGLTSEVPRNKQYPTVSRPDISKIIWIVSKYITKKSRFAARYYHSQIPFSTRHRHHSAAFTDFIIKR